jgi:superfamily I DNA and/or RNA helicase/very-short-patch-repair endonuclease
VPDKYRFCSTCGTELQGLVGSKAPAPITILSTEKQTSKNYSQLHTSLYKKLEYYRNKVLNTDVRNRSILLRSISDSGRSFFDLAGINSSSEVVEHALIDRRPVCIIVNSNKSQAADRGKIRLTNLYRNITQIRRESGREETYLGFPFLVGHISDQTYVRGPLILFPASITYKQQARTAGWYIEFSEDKDPILNRALMQLVKKHVSIPDTLTKDFENLLNKLEEGKYKGNNNSIELHFLEGLLEILQQNNFLLDYNYKIPDRPEILSKIYVNRGSVSVDEKKTWFDNEKLHLANFKIVGNFPQGENAIYLDYEDMLKKARQSDDFGVIKKLLPNDVSDDKTPRAAEEIENVMEAEPIKLDQVPADKLNLAIASDSSQDNVVLMSQSSDCVVVRGPPGTGKSQVIVNLISNALAKGQRVLLVCEKVQALAVVYNRLAKVGLSEYIAPLYDAKNQKSLYKKFSSILESQDTTQDSDDTNLLNQKFSYYCQEIDKIVDKQNRIVDAIKDESIAGISVNKLYILSKYGYVAKLDLSKIMPDLQYHTLTQLLDIVRNLEHACKKFDNPSFPWVLRGDFSNLSFNDKDIISNIIDKIIAILNQQNMPLFVSKITDQKILIDALDDLMNTPRRGMFHRLLMGGGKAQAAHDNVKRLLNQSHIPEDADVIKDWNRRGKTGLQIFQTFNELLPYIKEEHFDNLSRLLLEGNQNAFTSTLADMRESVVSYFDELQAYDRAKAELTSNEVELLKMCNDRLSSESPWDEILEQEFYLHWIKSVEQKHPDLKGQPFETYMANRSQLNKLINKQQKIVVQKIINQINNSIMRPEIDSRSNRSYRARYDQWSILLAELNQRRHVLPIRKLVEKYESIILKIAPCWLATPPAVSAIFPIKRSIFDYIIFDEASQSNVANSLPALERGKNLIVIGDEKQLPPVSHFRVKDDYDDDNDEDTVDRALLSDSMLSLANRVFNHSYLTWHYRSVYPELIDFSNHAFYDSRLKVVPNTSKDTVPIRWISCNDRSWVGRKNKQEAVLVVDELKNMLLQNKQEGLNRSVGIITFNYPQQEEIRDEIDRRKQGDPEFQELYSYADNEEKNTMADLPFVRNIERVQGEERDIIIFSTGYTKDLANEDDSIGVRFGSLNQQDGEHYLNVAITRARYQIKIVCSFDPNKINVENALHDGPKRLKEYLCYAKAISEDNPQEVKRILSSLPYHQTKSTVKFGHMDENNYSLDKLVANELQKLSYKVEFNVGHSDYKIDLAVIHPDTPSKYILAIECDGRSFLSAASTKERDVTRQQFLESKGWRVEQVWSRNWWRDPKKEISRLHQKIQELRTHTSDDIINRSESILLPATSQSNEQSVEDVILEELINKGESDTLEFKSSMVWDYKLGKPNAKSLWHPVLKTVVAFMNSEGGKLIVGVSDNGEILGLDKDFEALGKKKTWDEWIQHFISEFNEHVGKELITYVKIRRIYHNERHIAVIEVKKNDSAPTYLDPRDKSEFYIRSGTTTQPLNPKETVVYVRQHWNL